MRKFKKKHTFEWSVVLIWVLFFFFAFHFSNESWIAEWVESYVSEMLISSDRELFVHTLIRISIWFLLIFFLFNWRQSLLPGDFWLYLALGKTVRITNLCWRLCDWSHVLVQHQRAAQMFYFMWVTERASERVCVCVMIRWKIFARDFSHPYFVVFIAIAIAFKYISHRKRSNWSVGRLFRACEWAFAWAGLQMCSIPYCIGVWLGCFSHFLDLSMYCERNTAHGQFPSCACIFSRC